jgi:radical SAM enzyme (TIGR01210 family)
MFIHQVIAKIREPYTHQFNDAFRQAVETDTEELYRQVLKEIESVCKRVDVMEDANETMFTTLTTTGCTHWFRDGKFSACTMCNHMAGYIESLARIHALKQKDTGLYAKAVRYSFDVQRGDKPEPYFMEAVTGFDTLNPEELPEEAYKELFANGSLFKHEPFRYVFETRPSSVTAERIAKWKKVMGERVAVELGIEVGDQWIRNHWINKNISNRQFENAVNLIREANWRTSANLLIGIPGLTDRQSIHLFIESAAWLEGLEVDHIICSPIVRIERTLQEFLYLHLKDNRRLIDLGISRGEQTGIPWVFTILEALHSVYSRFPSLLEKLSLSFINFSKYLGNYYRCYAGTPMSKSIDTVVGALKAFYGQKDLGVLDRTRTQLKRDPNYLRYLEVLQHQAGPEQIQETLQTVGEEVAKILWPDSWESMTRSFSSEQSSYH